MNNQLKIALVQADLVWENPIQNIAFFEEKINSLKITETAKLIKKELNINVSNPTIKRWGKMFGIKFNKPPKEQPHTKILKELDEIKANIQR